MNKETRTFAYILLASKLTQELESELSEYYWGGIVEAFISCEEQSIAPEGLYPFGWESIMNRVAPVQMANGWDPRNNLMEALLNEGDCPRFISGDEENLPNIIFFDQPSMKRITEKTINIIQLKDRRQFNNVLKVTLQLCSQEKLGLLFIGGWGFSYEDNQLNNDEQKFLADCGFQITSRHE